jgi:hypothetical protein
MLGIGLALIALGVIVLLFFPILGVVILVVGVIALLGHLLARRRRAAAETGGP